MDDQVTIQKADLPAIELLKESKELLGLQYWLFVGIALVAMLIAGAVPMGILMGPMMAGLYLCYAEKRKRGEVEFGTLFNGFEHFMETLVATLIIVGISCVVIIPAYFLFLFGTIAGMAAFAENAPIVGFLIMVILAIFYALVVFLVSLPFLFVYPLIVLHGLKAVPAIKASANGVLKNLGAVTIMVLVYGLISMAAAMACVIPVYLFLPIYFGALYLAYLRIFPRAEDSVGEAKPVPQKPAF